MAGCLQLPQLRVIQARAAALADRFNERERKQLYQLDVTIRLEGAAPGGAAPPPLPSCSITCTVMLREVIGAPIKEWMKTVTSHYSDSDASRDLREAARAFGKFVWGADLSMRDDGHFAKR